MSIKRPRTRTRRFDKLERKKMNAQYRASLNRGKPPVMNLFQKQLFKIRQDSRGYNRVHAPKQVKEYFRNNPQEKAYFNPTRKTFVPVNKQDRKVDDKKKVYTAKGIISLLWITVIGFWTELFINPVDIGQAGDGKFWIALSLLITTIIITLVGWLIGSGKNKIDTGKTPMAFF